jgi:hypothetical protein
MAIKIEATFACHKFNLQRQYVAKSTRKSSLKLMCTAQNMTFQNKIRVHVLSWDVNFCAYLE